MRPHPLVVLNDLGVKLVCKDDSALMKIVSVLGMEPLLSPKPFAVLAAPASRTACCAGASCRRRQKPKRYRPVHGRPRQGAVLLR